MCVCVGWGEGGGLEHSYLVVLRLKKKDRRDIPEVRIRPNYKWKKPKFGREWINWTSCRSNSRNMCISTCSSLTEKC